MPPKIVTNVGDRVVVVATYVETPRRRRFSSNNHRRDRYRASNGTNNRRSDLLNYSRRLRESGRLEPATPLLLHPKPESSSSNNQHPMKQIVPPQSKSKHGTAPTCLGNCKMEVPSFLKSLIVCKCKEKRTAKKKRSNEPTATQMKTLMQSFQKQKKPGFFAKFFAGMKKHV